MAKFTNLSTTLFTFFKKLGYEVYMEGLVPSGVSLPYVTITYESNSFVGESMLLQGRIWTKSNSRKLVNQISDDLEEIIGEGVKLPIDLDNGYIAFYKGSPFIQPLIDEDMTLQVNYFNLEMQIF